MIDRVTASRIVGTGRAVPPRVLTNEDLSRMVDAEIVVPGNPNASRMIDRILVRGDMPPRGDRVPQAEIDKLVGSNPKGTGWLDPAAYDRTVQILMSGKSAPVITKTPEGAWTHDVFNKAATIQ